jgi:hypothetical protein
MAAEPTTTFARSCFSGKGAAILAAPAYLPASGDRLWRSAVRERDAHWPVRRFTLCRMT